MLTGGKASFLGLVEGFEHVKDPKNKVFGDLKPLVMFPKANRS